MIAVGVGSEFDRNELEIIADNNRSIFTVSNYSNLITIMIGLQDAISNAGSTNLEGNAWEFIVTSKDNYNQPF